MIPHMMMRLGMIIRGTSSDLGPAPGEDENEEEGGTGPGDGEEDSDDESEGKGKGEPSESEDESEEDDAGESGDDESGDDESDGDDSDDGEDSEGKGDSDDGDGDDSDSDSDDDSDDPQKGRSEDESGGGSGPKDGPEDAGSRDGPEDDGEVAASLLDSYEAEEESGLLDNNESLSESVKELNPDVRENECAWSPYTTEFDVIYRPQKTEERKRAAERFKKKVRTIIAAIRSKLRNRFLQANAPEVQHGVRKGRALSERRLVDSVVELRSGRRPTRPDWRDVQKDTCTLAAALVVDESGSMDGQLIKWAIMAMIAIGEALDKLGCPVLAIGPRNAGPGYRYPPSSPDREEVHTYDPDANGGRGAWVYHYSRTDSVVIDVFKDWNERMAAALPRFAAVKACGSTPLSDGIQFALQELQARPERHRVVFVITDGCPDNQNCVRWQIRTAAEAGVTVVGVGIGYGAGYVKQLFPVHVCVPDVDSLPQELLRVLGDIMFPKRARKMDLGAKKMKTA